MYDYDDYEFPEETPERFWTLRRAIFMLITLLTLLAFLTYVLIVPLVQVGRSPRAFPTPTQIPRF